MSSLRKSAKGWSAQRKTLHILLLEDDELVVSGIAAGLGLHGLTVEWRELQRAWKPVWHFPQVSTHRQALTGRRHQGRELHHSLTRFSAAPHAEHCEKSCKGIAGQALRKKAGGDNENLRLLIKYSF